MQGSEIVEKAHEEKLHLPAPTVWPMVLALGITLCIAGLVTSLTVSVLGLILTAMGMVGWFRNVLPHERHEGAGLPIHVVDIKVVKVRNGEVGHPQASQREQMRAAHSAKPCDGDAGLAQSFLLVLRNPPYIAGKGLGIHERV